MLVKQIAVFIENKKGRLLELTETLGKNGIDLLTLSIADTNDFGILRAMARDNEKAVKVLREAGFTVTSTQLIGVQVSDTPGGLAKVLKLLDDNGVSIEYLYSFAHNTEGKAIILFKVDEENKAIEVLTKNNVTIIDGTII